MICEELGPPYTEGAITQHLAKLRGRRVEAGLPVPPPLRRSPKEAEKQAAAQKRKNASSNGDDEQDDGTDNGGLFIDEDEEYLTPKRARKRTKAKKDKADETISEAPGPARTTRNSRFSAQLDPMAEPTEEFATYYPSSAPSPFDVRYRQNFLQDNGGTVAQNTSTGIIPITMAQPRVVPASMASATSAQFVPWTATVPVIPGNPAVHGQQNFGKGLQGQSFTPIDEPLAYTPGFQSLHAYGSPVSAGRPMTSPDPTMVMNQGFGPGYQNHSQYWYGPQPQSWMQSPAQPARDQGSGVIDPQLAQSEAQSEAKVEGDPTESDGFEKIDFKEFVNGE